MLAKKTIVVYGDDNVVNQIKDNGGATTSVKFLSIDELAFLRVVVKKMIETNSHSHLLNDDEMINLYVKLTQSSVLYESKA